jgi:hypothetical protein
MGLMECLFPEYPAPCIIGFVFIACFTTPCIKCQRGHLSRDNAFPVPDLYPCDFRSTTAVAHNPCWMAVPTHMHAGP